MTDGEMKDMRNRLTVAFSRATDRMIENKTKHGPKCGLAMATTARAMIRLDARLDKDDRLERSMVEYMKKKLEESFGVLANKVFQKRPKFSSYDNSTALAETAQAILDVERHLAPEAPVRKLHKA